MSLNGVKDEELRKMLYNLNISFTSLISFPSCKVQLFSGETELTGQKYSIFGAKQNNR